MVRLSLGIHLRVNQLMSSPKRWWFTEVLFGGFEGPTVDGSEIRRSPVEVGSLVYTIICRVLYIPGGAGSFFHQQYENTNRI